MKNLEQAMIARERAYTPYSNFKVGAAILLKDGTYIHGANIENASFGLSNCAERSALFSLYSQGFKKEDIVSITIVANDNGPVSPCGACRQVMHELLPRDAKIILANTKGETMETTTDGLLPYAFVLDEKPNE
ncbi:cytidine deaminase [Peloplasma aerotolerans]|uniref:Cytidine deaminase n=1 Tax=Peloplasma aerotolerans TaxID=3044389 RepID=A0AAW6U931_9MOLU|nr:cytidine deaminase [Mariniplasma sp. M4Ah]MDI6452613.1 cytidine deaminase [Mariniplasma sp. M4Ah]